MAEKRIIDSKGKGTTGQESTVSLHPYGLFDCDGVVGVKKKR